MVSKIREARRRLDAARADAESEIKRVRDLAQTEIIEAESHLLEAYFERIRDAYNSGSGEGKTNIIEELGRVSIFDRGIARQTRRTAGLSLVQVAEIVGCSDSYLQGFEGGQRRLSPSTKGRVPMSYLQFLREHGYDPFGL